MTLKGPTWVDGLNTCRTTIGLASQKNTQKFIYPGPILIFIEKKCAYRHVHSDWAYNRRRKKIWVTCRMLETKKFQRNKYFCRTWSTNLPEWTNNWHVPCIAVERPHLPIYGCLCCTTYLVCALSSDSKCMEPSKHIRIILRDSTLIFLFFLREHTLCCFLIKFRFRK
jgi:hypothetical protein